MLDKGYFIIGLSFSLIVKFVCVIYLLSEKLKIKFILFWI